MSKPRRDPSRLQGLGRLRQLQAWIGLARTFRRIALVSLAASFRGEMSTRRIRWLATRCILEKLRFHREHRRMRQGKARCSEVRNAGALLAVQQRGAGAIVCAPHLGPYPWLAVELARLGLNPQVVMNEAIRQQYDPIFRKLADDLGQSMRSLAAQRPRDLLRGLRAVREGGTLLLFADGNLGAGRTVKDRVSIPLLSVSARVRTSAAHLSFRTGAPLVMAAVYHSGRKIVAEFSEPLPVPRSRAPEALAQTTREMYAWFEQQIRRHPAEWDGWLLPHFFFGESGDAPTATSGDLESATRSWRAALASEGARLRCHADPLEIAVLGGEMEWEAYHGPTRRALVLGPVALAALRSAVTSSRVGRLLGEPGISLDSLADALARLSLAGLLRHDGAAPGPGDCCKVAGDVPRMRSPGPPTGGPSQEVGT